MNLNGLGGVLVGVTERVVLIARQLFRFGLVVVTLAFAPIAAAKGGPIGIAIDGPAMHQPLQIGGTVTTNPTRIHYQLVEETRFFDFLFGVDGQPLPQDAAVPAAGDSYTITWLWHDTPIPMEVYPYAKGGPMVHMAPGLHGFSDEDHQFGVGARGGWVRADSGLLDLMVELGVPLDPEHLQQSSAGANIAMAVSAVGLLTVAIGTVAFRRRRAWVTPSPQST